MEVTYASIAIEQLNRLPDDFPNKLAMMHKWSIGFYETLPSKYTNKVIKQYTKKIDEWLK